MNPAAEVIGNHDLDYGFDAVENFTAASEFPWLAANIQKQGTDGENVPGTKDYTIVERDGVKVGIVGLVDEAIKGKTAVDFDAQGYELTDFVETGEEVATTLKEDENVDVVVAAAHIGIPDSKELANQTDNIDAIVVGDDEREYPPEETGGAVLVEGAGRGEFLGEVNLTVTENDVTFDSGRLVTVSENENIPVNETVSNLVNDSRGKYLSEVAGSTNVDLDSRFGSNYGEDTRWGNVITDAFLAETGAEVAITNAGGIRGNFVMEPGDITYDDVYTSLPFGNYLVTKSMPGDELKALLESQVTPLDADFGGQAQLQVSGVTYEFVDRPGADATVTDVHVDGEPLDEDENYEVTVNSFMAGWDRISQLPTVSENFKLYGTATVEYVESISPITEDTADTDRIRRVTRAVGADAPSADGSQVTLSYDLPEEVTEVNASTIRLQNEVGGVLAAEDASVSDGTMTATFDADSFDSLEGDSDTLELYGQYTDAEYSDQRNGWSYSVLNGEVVTRYVEDDGTVSTSSFQDAVEDWTNGDLSRAKLQFVLNAWITSQ
jgi:2',3'-cyclic-nucleotide 2'-phosphodiesterase (5'-nucleotidase family)